MNFMQFAGNRIHIITYFKILKLTFKFLLTRKIGMIIIIMSRKLVNSTTKLVGGAYMNKEEILAKSRMAKTEEREVMVRDRSLRWTMLAMPAHSEIFDFIRESRGQSIMDLTVVLCGSCFVTFIYRFMKTKRKDCLILGIISAVAAILALIRFIKGY